MRRYERASTLLTSNRPVDDPRHIQAHAGAHGVRQIPGVLVLAKKHGVAVVDDAAKAAIDIGVLTYRFIRKYVERRPPLPPVVAGFEVSIDGRF